MHRSARYALACLALAAACGGGDQGGGPGNSLIVLPTVQDIQDCGTSAVSATLYDGNGDPIAGAVFTYSSSDPGVATVAGGTVTGVAPGTADIIVAHGTLKDTSVVTVLPAPHQLTVSTNVVTLFETTVSPVGVSLVDCHGNPPIGATLTYSTSNPAVATFAAGGITGVAPGTTVVSVASVADALDEVIDVVVKDIPMVVDSSEVSDNPFGIAASATRVYVTRLSSGTISDATLPSTTFDIAGFAVGPTPTDVAFSPNGQKAYVTNQDDATVGVIDVATRTQVATIPVSDNPYRVLVNAAGDRAFVTNQNDFLYVINTATDAVIDSVRVASSANGLAFSPDNSRLYVSHTSGTIHVIDAVTYVPIDTIPLPGQLQDIAVSPDGTLLYVAHEGIGVEIWSIAGDNLIATITVPAFGLKLSPDGALIYVSGGTKLSFIDRLSLAVATVNVGGVARRIAFEVGGTKAFVANESGYVTVIQ